METVKRILSILRWPVIVIIVVGWAILSVVFFHVPIPKEARFSLCPAVATAEWNDDLEIPDLEKRGIPFDVFCALFEEPGSQSSISYRWIETGVEGMEAIVYVGHFASGEPVATVKRFSSPPYGKLRFPLKKFDENEIVFAVKPRLDTVVSGILFTTGVAIAAVWVLWPKRRR